MNFPLLSRQSFPPEKTETITVPGAEDAYTFKLKYIPALNRTPTISFTGLSSIGGGYVIVPHLPSGPGEVYWKSGTDQLIFHSSDSGISAGTATYNALGSPVRAEDINFLYDMIMAAGGTDTRTLAVSGAPTARVVGHVLIPSKDLDSRTITRITVSASDTLAVSGPTTITVADPGDVANIPVTLLAAENKATATGSVEIDTSGGDVWLPIECTVSGGHGNLSITVEVE